jgi:peptide/nickel transport system substrate-binding protein
MIPWRKVLRVWGFVAIVVGSMLLTPLYSLVGAAVAQDEEVPEKILRAGFLQPVDSMNPMLGLNDASYIFYGLIYDNPHCIDKEMNIESNLVVDTQPVPATDPEIALAGRPYGSIWEYTVTPNAEWHDGEPFTIDDFIWNMELHSKYYDIMWAFQPYSYFMEKVEKVDEDTARIYFFNRDTEEPMACAYAYLLAVFLMPRHLLSAESASYISFEWPGYFEDTVLPVVGTGPFMVTDEIEEEWTAGDHLTLVKNPNYHWGADKGMNISFDKIIMYFYDDATSMRLALTSGDLDIAQFPPETYKALNDGIADGTYDNLACYDGLKCTQYWTEIEFCMNEGGPNPSRLDPAIRQALATATDKEYIVTNYYRSLAEEGTTLIPSINEKWHYEPTAGEKFVYDLDAAADMLDDAGYRYPYDGADLRVVTSDSLAAKEGWAPPDTELSYHMYVRREYPEEALIAKYLKETWAQVGVGLDYEVVDESYMSTEVYSYEYDTCIWYWSADIDPNYMLFCQSKIAWSGWSDNKYYNESYEENYLASVSAMDDDERKTYVDNCQRIHYRDAAFIIMAAPYQTYVWRTDTFENWGDWDDSPGMSMDNFWGGNPLFFDLEYIGDRTQGFDLMSALMFGGVIAAVVVAVAAVWLLKKRGKKGKASPLGE